MAAAHVNMELFGKGVAAALQHWEALSVAVDQRWGGDDSVEKADWMAEVIVDLFRTSKSGKCSTFIHMSLYCTDTHINKYTDTQTQRIKCTCQIITDLQSRTMS